MIALIRLGMAPGGGRAYWAARISAMVLYDLVDNFGIDEVRAINNNREAAYFRVWRKGKNLIPLPEDGVGWAWRKVFKDGTSRIEGPNPELFD